MKKILISLLAMLPIMMSAQTFSETKDVDLDKSELFTATKEFIADNQSGTKPLAINEDKDGGIIQLKCSYIDKIGIGMGLSCVYVYEYKVKFRVKDNKYRIEIYDIECVDAQQVGLGTSNDVPLIPYFEGDNVPEKTKKTGKGISKKQAIKMRDGMNATFNAIIQYYNNFISSYEPF